MLEHNQEVSLADFLEDDPAGTGSPGSRDRRRRMAVAVVRLA
jgi:hypothetical protein